MNFEITYSPEQERLRTEARAWFEREVPSGLLVRPSTERESAEQYRQRRELGRKLGERGWLYPSFPKEYGGGGQSLEGVIVLEEEAHRAGISLPPYYDSGGKYGAASILALGTEEQKRSFVPPICQGAVRTWQLLSEPDAGSDLAAVQTRAVRAGDSYDITGQKVFVGSAHGTQRLWVLTQTDPIAPRHQNLSFFMIDANLPGIDIQPQPLLSCHGEDDLEEGHKNTVFFDHTRVPAFALIGGENNGWKVANTHLALEHGGRGTTRPHRILALIVEYCRITERDGRPLMEDPLVRARLSEIYMRLEAVRLLGVRNFWLASTGGRMTYEGPLKLAYLQKTTGLWLTREIADLVGPSALTSDARLGALDGYAERQQRDGIVDIHPGGTTDIHKMLIARGLGLGKRRTPVGD